jgi:hypothetical protein
VYTTSSAAKAQVVVSADDVVTPSAATLQVFETAAQPKKLVIITGGHFDACHGPSGGWRRRLRATSSSEHLGVEPGLTLSVPQPFSPSFADRA